MNKFLNKLTIFLIACMLIPSASVFAQEEAAAEEGYTFEMITEIPHTTVKDQNRSGTCWSFSTIGFLESELMREGKGEYDLSEMFTVRNSYSDKAEKYMRMHGSLNFGGGGACHDVTDVWTNYGIVPESAYSGLNYGLDNHAHGEMDAVLEGYMDAALKNKNRKLTPAWHRGLNGILDAYLGSYPETFVYQGVEYTPRSFADMLGLDMNDYVELSSFTHHPFYEKFILEVPDNWAWGEVYNVPLDELIAVIDNSLENGYSVAWAADVSHKGFSFRNGVAIIPETDVEEMDNSERLKWEAMSEKDRSKMLYSFDKPRTEKEITQELRQEAFDDFQTTDDHGMQLVGIAKDQNGTPYYYVKNSWADNSNKYDGFFYVSKPFVKLQTTCIMVNKNAIPKELRKKLGIK